MKSPLRYQVCVIVAGLLVLATANAAIVQVDVVGTVHLDLETGDGIDDDNIDGASFVGRYQYDSTALAISNPASSALSVTVWYPSLIGEQRWFNRPNNAPDQLFVYQPIISLNNRFLPGGLDYDTLRFFASGPFGVGPGPSVYFPWDYFPGTAPAQLPEPLAEDPVHLTVWDTFGDYYLDYRVSVSVIPVPAAFWLLGSALGVLRLATRRNHLALVE